MTTNYFNNFFDGFAGILILKQMNKVEKQLEMSKVNIRQIPLFKSVVIDEISSRIKQSCDESSRFKNIVKIGELIKISPLLNKYKF